MSNTPTYLIRTALPDDIEGLIELCAEHAAYERASYERRGKRERLSSALFLATPRVYAWVVVRNGYLVGYATATQEFSTWDAALFLHMDCLYLREEVRGCGLGRLLVREITHLALQLGCTNIQWQTPTWNEHAIRFYQHLGAKSMQKVRFFFSEADLETFLT